MAPGSGGAAYFDIPLQYTVRIIYFPVIGAAPSQRGMEPLEHEPYQNLLQGGVAATVASLEGPRVPSFSRGHEVNAEQALPQQQQGTA